MKTIIEKDGMFSYYNKWEAEYGCRNPAIVMTDWIFTDKEMKKFQAWLDKRGEL